MVQAAEDRARDDPPGRDLRGTRRRWPGKRRPRAQAAVGPRRVVGGEVLPEHTVQVPLVADQHVVQTLGAHGGMTRSAMALARGARNGVSSVWRPRATARGRSAYCRPPLSVFSTTCRSVRCRTYR